MDMIITDKTNKPTLSEIKEYADNRLFNEMFDYCESEFKAVYSIEFSRDNALPGWNVRLHKSGRTLCRLYPRKGSFTVLLVIGRKEKERTEAILTELSAETQEIYENTVEGMGQRWLLIKLSENYELYGDILRLVRIRRESK